MKALFVISAIVLLGASSIAKAQVTIDVSKITCDEFVKYEIAEPKQIAIWLSGYYHGTRGSTILDTQELLQIMNRVE